MSATFTTVDRIVTGWGCVEQLPALAGELGGRMLLVTGKGAMREAGLTGRLVDMIERAGLAVTLFEQARPEPTVEVVDAGRQVFRENGCKVVVAVGGGSAIDVGKAIAGLANLRQPTKYFFNNPVGGVGAGCIAVPTTAGTGAEVTPNSVLTDEEAGLKQSIRGGGILPKIALVDAELTVSCPPLVTAAAGMDALTQGIESYWSRGATPLTDALALHAVELAWDNLPVAVDEGQDRPAREAMSYAALLAGLALANARLGLVHGVAHSVGHRRHAAHGVVCGALLPHVMRFNRQARPEKYEMLSTIFGGDAADRVEQLLHRLRLPIMLGLREDELDDIVRESLPSGSLKANPRQPTNEEIKDLLRKIM